MKRYLNILLIAAAVMSIVAARGQRRVTPVNNAATVTQHINENKANGDSLDRSRLVEMTDASGNVILVDTVSGREFVDSVALKQQKKVPKMIYPLFHAVTVSADLFTPAMRAFGTKYGLVEFAGQVNLHNRYLPTIEIGLGQADYTPDDNNYSYHTPVSPFFRIGMDYNFLYQSNPDYLIMAGVRYGFSPFKFNLTDITQQPGYWDQPMTYEIPSQSVTAGYFQLLLALRVRIVGNISLGWSVRYQSIMHESSTPHGKAWYIPGFGARNRSINATFSVAYTLPLHKGNTVDRSTEATIDALPPAEGNIPPDTIVMLNDTIAPDIQQHIKNDDNDSNMQ